MIKKVRFQANSIQPSPIETMYWVDLSEDSTGKEIKVIDNEGQWTTIFSEKENEDTKQKIKDLTDKLNWYTSSGIISDFNSMPQYTTDSVVLGCYQTDQNLQNKQKYVILQPVTKEHAGLFTPSLLEQLEKGGDKTIGQLLNVDESADSVDTPNNYVLTYDSVDQIWKPKKSSGGGGGSATTIGELDNVYESADTADINSILVMGEGSVYQPNNEVVPTVAKLKNEGWKPVANVEEMENIDTSNLAKGTACYVFDEDRLYAWTGTEWKEKSFGSGGGSGTVQRNLRVINELDSKNISAAKNEPCYLRFKFISQERYDTEEPYVDTGERGLCQLSIRNSKYSDYTVVKEQWVNSNASISIDVQEYLTQGTNSIMIRITGEVTEATTPAFTYIVTLTSLTITSDNFAWNTAYKTDFTLPLNIGGNINKTLYVLIEGDEYRQQYEVPLGTNVYTETYYNYTVTHPGAVGIYQLSAWVVNEDGTIRTKTISFNIMCTLQGDDTKLMVVNNQVEKLTNWIENTAFEYAIYEGDNQTAAANFTITKDNQEVFNSQQDSILTSTKQKFTFSMEIDTPDNSEFNVTIEVTDEKGIDLIEPINIPVNNSLGFSATAGAVFYMNPKTRNNSQSNRLKIINEIDQSIVNATWKGMNWGNDGWQLDKDGSMLLRLMAGASIDIDYKPFEKESARTGKTIEIDYKVSNVTDYSQDVITIDQIDGDSFIGLQIQPDRIAMYSQSERDIELQSISTDNDVRIRLTLVITPDAYGNPGFNVVYIYINGKKNRTFTYQSNDYFSNNGTIKVGSNYSDIDIYGIRVYDFGLNSQQVLRNYVNWLPDIASKERVNADNDVLDVNGSDIEFDNVRDQYNVFIFDVPFPSYSNPSKKTGTIEMQYTDTPELNATVTNCSIAGQGTSSMRYYEWNQKVKIDKTKSVITYADGSTAKKKVKMFYGVPECATITWKKNWASSMQDHKAGSVNSYTDLFKKVGLTNEAIELDPEVRVTCYQEPFVGFYRTVNEEGKTIYVCMGEFTGGPDKGDKNCFGFDTDVFPNLISIEGSDNSPLLTLCRVPWNPNKPYVKYNADEEAWQYNGANSYDFGAGVEDNISLWIPAYNLVYTCSPRLKPFNGTLDEMNEQAKTLRNDPNEFWISKEGDPNQYNVYYYESAENMFIPSDIGNGQINLKEQLCDKEYGLTAAGLEGNTDDEKNELFKNARITKFRLEAAEYFDIEDAAFHHAWSEFAAGTDNRAKNTYAYNFGTSTSKWKWRQDDLDTIFPVNNQGQLSKSYSVEMHDVDETGASIWNGETNNFWNLLELSFPDTVTAVTKQMMTAMTELSGISNGTDYDKLYAFYTKYYLGVKEYFPHNLVNADAKRYEIAKIAYGKGDYSNDTDPITQSLGDCYSTETAWMKKRIVYMMSKYSFGLFSADGTDNITVRAAGNTITYDLTPAIDLYPAIANGTSIIRGQRTKAGQKCTMLIDLSGSGDQQNTIQGASYLQDIGEWYDKNVQGTMVIQGKMLRQIKLGHQTKPVTITISSLTLSNCVSLQELVLSNISTLTGALDLTACTHLRKVYADGTNLSQIKLPSGGGLEYIYFSKNNRYLSLSNYTILSNAGVNISLCSEIITDLFIANCPNIRPIELLVNIMDIQKAQGTDHALKRIRLQGFEETYYTSDMLDKLTRLSDGTYEGLNSAGIAGDDPLPVLDGTLIIHANAYEDSISSLRKSFPKLILNVIGEYYIRFKDNLVGSTMVTKYGDGSGITKKQMAVITNSSFSSNPFRSTKIQYFEEFQYLTGLTTINAYAFSECTQLESIILPANIKEIQTYAFQNTHLINITIPKSVQNIRTLAFYSNNYLTNITFEEGRTNSLSIGEGTFRNCTNLQEVIFPNNTSADINMHSLFENCTSLKKVELPTQGITQIYNNMFKGCSSLTDVTIPKTITKFGSNCFSGCRQLTEINIPRVDHTIEFMFGSLQENGITRMVVQNNWNVNLASNLFSSCESLITVIIEEGISNTLPTGAFNRCLNLLYVDISSTITTFGKFIFFSCQKLQTIIMRSNSVIKILEEASFGYGFSSTAKFYVPDNLIDAYEADDWWKQYAGRFRALSTAPEEPAQPVTNAINLDSINTEYVTKEEYNTLEEKVNLLISKINN